MLGWAQDSDDAETRKGYSVLLSGGLYFVTLVMITWLLALRQLTSLIVQLFNFRIRDIEAVRLNVFKAGLGYIIGSCLQIMSKQTDNFLFYIIISVVNP